MSAVASVSSEARFQVEIGALPRSLAGDPMALARLYDERIGRREWDDALGILTRPYRLYALRAWWQSGTITLDELRSVLPGTWSDAEPDSELRWWPLFRDAGYCGEVLPAGDPLTVYRGGQPGDTLGIAWTLERRVAVFFALRLPYSATSSAGVPMQSGEVITGEVARAKVRAYITDRQESEGIMHPRSVRIVARETVESKDGASPAQSGAWLRELARHAAAAQLAIPPERIAARRAERSSE